MKDLPMIGPRHCKRCERCGRFLRKVVDIYTGKPAGWRCPKLWYVGRGKWEHA